MQIYDRLQTRAVTLLVPLSYFVEADFDHTSLMQTSFSEESSKHIIFVNEQQTNTWINVTYFMICIKISNLVIDLISKKILSLTM